ncbi:PLP-dependent aminotransferase family protein [Aestuariispira insulae]|uniref:GntR family transcriptional regulator n=1 Tax=Aestuariispira insulae TaxID=1461337 RepID=A0A3D9HN62_9PROT|nr:PLP-dependent aminotransferase family protein [Aestuariispira insulae]RED50947.1 GntR family transcriptional regulator [Aestuariispira insulae]
MRSTLFHLEKRPTASIQSQIREMLVSHILKGDLPDQEALPSCRALAKQLGVSRNTVVLAYQGLVDDGYLIARERSGFFVNGEILKGRVEQGKASLADEEPSETVDWQGRLRNPIMRRQWHFDRTERWQDLPYPFLYGQMDYSLFPLSAWRECSRQAMGTRTMESVTPDSYDRDDPDLIEQIRSRLLPRRGINASQSEILVTLGAQNALYLIGSLLVRDHDRVGVENPGYPDARHIFRQFTDQVVPLAVDDSGLVVDETLDECRYVLATPSHHFPTTVTMSLERRKALLDKAFKHDFLLIEDDYEPETNFISNPAPALKSLDRQGRVIYMGSFSKSLFPGLRLGYIVAQSAVIEELRALRRLMYRHPPGNNQRTAALFLGLGHYDSLVTKLQRTYRERWEVMGDALQRYLPNASEAPVFGGSSYWVRGPEGMDSLAFAQNALEKGVALDPCVDFFFEETPGPRNFIRLGFSSIPTERIEPGIKLVSELMKQI